MTLDATIQLILPFLVEELKEEIFDSKLVRLAHEGIEEDLEVRFTGIRSSVVLIARVLGSLYMQPWISIGEQS